mmetsp:Transcript_39306/g.126165  ORF Transcript_39306/g.126165 Transcript_39306/m.126165 type:complete len:271 (-) Transcript_39306:365-1177(-)
MPAATAPGAAVDSTAKPTSGCRSAGAATEVTGRGTDRPGGKRLAGPAACGGSAAPFGSHSSPASLSVWAFCSSSPSSCFPDCRAALASRFSWRLSFRRSWGKWQKGQSRPFWQRPFVKKLHRLQSPEACFAEPNEGSPSSPTLCSKDLAAAASSSSGHAGGEASASSASSRVGDGCAGCVVGLGEGTATAGVASAQMAGALHLPLSFFLAQNSSMKTSCEDLTTPGGCGSSVRVRARREGSGSAATRLGSTAVGQSAAKTASAAAAPLAC